MGAARSQDGAVSREALASNHHNTIAELSMEALVVELLENKLEMTWKVHNSRWNFVVIKYCVYCFLASGLLLLLQAGQQYNEGHRYEQLCCSGTEFSVPRLLKTDRDADISQKHTSSEMREDVVYVAAFPPDRLEYGRAMSNNNAEGCGAVSGFASKKSLDI